MNAAASADQELCQGIAVAGMAENIADVGGCSTDSETSCALYRGYHNDTVRGVATSTDLSTATYANHACFTADLMCVESPNGEELLDCVRGTGLESIPWMTDRTGKPGNFVPYQDRGVVRFRFTDSSQCETGFAFSRDGQQFISDYAFEGDIYCNSVFDPESHFDDLSLDGEEADGGRRHPGQTHEYSIWAASAIGAGSRPYSSAKTHAAVFTVQFEAVIKGTVVTNKAALPVEGVSVTATVVGGQAVVPFTDVSGKDGTFEIHIIDPSTNLMLTENVVLTYSKTTDTVNSTNHSVAFHHEFLCAGVECGGSTGIDATETVAVHHLDLNHKHWVKEISSAPFTGSVYFPAVKPKESASYSDSDWPWGESDTDDASSCFLEKANVCLKDYHNGGAAVVCASTLNDGTYELAAPAGMHLYVHISLGTHETFKRSSKSMAEDAEHRQEEGLVSQGTVSTIDKATGVTSDIVVDVFYISPAHLNVAGTWSALDFEDRATRTLQLDAHGTLCKLPLGTSAAFEIKYPKWPSCYGGTASQVDLDTGRLTLHTILLPAHLFDITLRSVDPPFEAATGMLQCAAHNPAWVGFLAGTAMAA